MREHAGGRGNDNGALDLGEIDTARRRTDLARRRATLPTISRAGGPNDAFSMVFMTFLAFIAFMARRLVLVRKTGDLIALNSFKSLRFALNERSNNPSLESKISIEKRCGLFNFTVSPRSKPCNLTASQMQVIYRKNLESPPSEVNSQFYGQYISQHTPNISGCIRSIPRGPTKENTVKTYNQQFYDKKSRLS
jgi:hypothetical protein